MNHNYQKDIAGCGLTGLIHKKKKRVSGEAIVKSLCLMNDRGNGLGAGYAAYGIYPDFKDFYAIHIMYDDPSIRHTVEEFLKSNFHVEKTEEIPTSPVKHIAIAPLLVRYFATPLKERLVGGIEEEDFVVNTVMKINSEMEGVYIFSSGKNMGTFKGVGNPAEIAEFFRINEYEGYIWTAHTRFPTNTPGWWGGAHPFTLLDWSIVHNGEISSYGINKRYLEMYGYKLTLLTDTEVVTYLLDLLVRKHGLDVDVACKALTSPFWKDIDDMEKDEREAVTALRLTYGSALLNGPFSLLFGHSNGLVGINDRIKLRPLVAATKGDFVYMASEESAIRAICASPDRVWAPRAGEPVIVNLEV
ncbi:MAG: glutamine amidotransferase family protein [Thermodesulfobacteriota bacterium]|nr:MAG: glutamine amidotransferase family protein [Thermodesulfobacteriota bacterium]